MIHRFKEGKLHVYIRQDTYKGKLRSENWVGRASIGGKQRIISSGTTDLEKAREILEKWYDEQVELANDPSQKDDNYLNENNEENILEVENNIDNSTSSVETSNSQPLENANIQVNVNENTNNNTENQNSKPIETAEVNESAPSSLTNKIQKKLNFKLNFSLFKRKDKSSATDKKKESPLVNFKKLFGEKISQASFASEEIAGIDISNESIKVAQLSKNDDKWILEKISLRLLDKSKINENILEAKDYVADELKLAMANAKISTSNVAISIPVTSAIIRVVTSPLMSDDELQKAIETDSLWENLVQLTDNLNEYSIFHQIISRNSKANTMEILFVASKLSDVNAYSSIIKKAGLNPVIMDVKCFTIKNAFDNSLLIENKANSALLEVGKDDNYLIIVHDNIPIITDIFLRPNEKEALSNYKIDSLVTETDSVIRRYCMQLKQALNDYENKYQVKINSIKVISNLNNVEDLISAFKKNLINTGLQVFNPLAEVLVPSYNQEKTNLNNKSIYTSVLGLAYRKLDVFGYYKFVTAVKNINLLPNREAVKKQNKMKFLSGFAVKGMVGGIAALYIFLMVLSFFQIRSNNEKLKNFDNVQMEFDKINKENIQVTKKFNDMTKTLKLGSVVNSNQIESYRALAQITRSVPQRVQFTELDYNGKDTVIIGGKAFSDQDIINFVSNLNEKDLIAQASLQAMNAVEGQSANNQKGFKILCKLKLNS